MKTRQSKRLHNQNVGTTKPEHLHNKEESTMSKYLYYTGYVILAALTLFFCWMFCLRIISENSFMRRENCSPNLP